MLKIYRQEFLAWQSLLEIYLLIDGDIIIEYLFDMFTQLLTLTVFQLFVTIMLNIKLV